MAVTGELVFDLKGADGVDVVTEEVDAEGILTAETIDVEDGASQGKLSWFIDIVNFWKP